MCISVITAPARSIRRLWNPPTSEITIPAGLSADASTAVVRAILSALGASQPPMGALCFCGEPVSVPGLTPRPLTRRGAVHRAS